MGRVLEREMTLILDEESEYVAALEPECAGQCVALVSELADRLSTRRRVSGRVTGRSLMTLETVCIETPARSATSRIVGRRPPCLPVIAPILTRALACGIRR